MFDLQVSDKVINYVENLLKYHNFGQRGIADGDRQQQKTGLIGQTVLSESFGCGKPRGTGGPDGGLDFEVSGKRIDVKTMGRKVYPKPYYVNNFLGLQKNYDTDVFIFCSYHKIEDILTVCGWISKLDFFDKAILYKIGEKRYRSDGTYFVLDVDNYEIENNQLHSPNSLDELINDINTK